MESHAPHYIVRCGVCGCRTFPHYLTNGMNFFWRGGVNEHNKCVLIFSATFVCNISYCNKKWGRYIVNVHTSPCKVPVILSDGNEIWTFSTDLRKILKFRFRECPSSGSRGVPYRRTDSDTSANEDDSFRNHIR